MNSKRSRKKEGYLQVKLSSRSALGKAWKRKWVVVQQNTSSSGKSLLLELYMEKGAYHKTVTSLLLEGVVGVRRTKSKTQEHAIEISSASRILLAISADSETETQEWLSMFQINLLPPSKELTCPPGIPQDFARVSVIPNKDSERLKLGGDYFAHISLASVNLHDTHTGDIALEWDLRHLRKFMLISKCHPLDAEKIVHILPSKRSPKGEGEFIFFSSKGKQIVEGIYDRLSNAMTVKSRRSRSTSMLFEITPQELEQMFKETEQPLEEPLQEAEEEEKQTLGKKDKGEANNETEEESTSGTGIKTNGVEVKEDVTAAKIHLQSDNTIKDNVQEEDTKMTTDGTHQETDQFFDPEETSGHVEEIKIEVKSEDGDGRENSRSPPTAELADVAEQIESVNMASRNQEFGTEHLEKREQDGVSDLKEQEDDKSNQTNPEEMDECHGPQMISTRQTEEQITSNDEVVLSDQDACQVEDAIMVTSKELVSSDCQESNPEVTAESSENVGSPALTSNEAVASIADDQCQNRAATRTPVDEHEVPVDETEKPSPKMETDQTVHLSTPEQSAKPITDVEGGSKTGSQENMISEKNPNPDLNKDMEAGELTNGGQTSLNLKEELKPSIGVEDSLQVTAKESTCIPTEKTEADTEEHTPSQNEALGAAEKIEQNSSVKMNQGVDEVRDAVVESSEKENADELSYQDTPDTDNKTIGNSPDAVVKILMSSEERPGESSENSSDVSNLNQNNSNSNQHVKRNSKTVPVPNSLTSRMAEAMRNVEERRLSTDAPTSQQTQTEFPPDRHGTDQSSEIIV